MEPPVVFTALTSPHLLLICQRTVVVGTGVEPVTSRFSGECSSRLSYPTNGQNRLRALVGPEGFEPPTSTLVGWHSAD